MKLARASYRFDVGTEQPRLSTNVTSDLTDGAHEFSAGRFFGHYQ